MYGQAGAVREMPEESEGMHRKVLELERALDEQKKAEESLRRINERLEMAQRAAKVGTWDWDIAGGRMEWSAQLFELFGIDPAQAGASIEIWKRILHPDDVDLAYRRIDEALRNRTTLDSDYRVIRADGSVRWVNARGENRYDGNGKPVRMIGICTDITERKMMEEAVRASEVKYRSLHRSMVDAFVSTDMDGFVTDCNESFLALLGYTLYEIKSLTYKDFTPEKWRDFEAAIFSGQILPRGYSDIYEKEYRRKDGTVFPVEIQVVLIRDSSGKPASMWATVRDITARRRAEDALRESEERYKTLVEKSLAGVYVVQDGYFVFLNDNAASYAGYRPDELTGRRSDFIVHPGDRTWIRQRARSMLKGENTLPYEFRIVTKTGHIRWIMETVTAIQFRGRPAILGNSMDITAHRQAEDALRESRELEQSILLSVPLALFGVERRRIFFANDAMEDVFGWQPEELIGKSTRVIFRSDEEWEGYGDTLYSTLSMQSVFVFESEIPFVRKDGREIFCRMSVSRIGPELGDSRRIVATFEDVTERRRVEEALRGSKERLQRTLEAVNDGVWDLDLATGRAVFSPKYYTMLGYDPYEFRQHYDSWRDLVHPEDRERAEREIKERLARNEGYAIDIRMRTKAGTWCWILTRGKAIEWDSRGNPVRLVGTQSDITERKRAEEEQEHLREQLIQAQKMESIGRLAGGVAHDFNNMLGVILGHVEMAMEEAEPEQMLLADLAEIRKAALRSTDLTRQLLAFARKQTVSPKVLDINETVSGLLKMLKRLIGEDIELAWMPGGELWPVKIDPSQVDQILANLCVNSRDAITGVGRIAIETANVHLDDKYCNGRPGCRPDRYVMLSVSDNGCGMSKQVLRKLFEPFFTTKETGKGTGLGLATVYGIVKQNDGFVEVGSELGRGTTVRVYLRRHIAEAEPARVAAPQAHAASGRETVLVVEDEPAILQLSKRMLEKQGYRVLTAGTPGEAIRLAGEHAGKIHLLMTDVVMPEMNGRELAEKLHGIYPELKHLFMSGYADDIIAQYGALTEDVGFLPKPFSMKVLADKVREVLDRH